MGNVRVEEITKDATEIVREQLESGKIIEGHMINVAEFRRILKLTLLDKGKENIIQAIKQLEARDDVICAQPSYHGSIDATYPNEYYSLSFPDKWAIDKIGLPNAWDKATGSSYVIVAVADTGIYSVHPELTNRISTIPSVAYIGTNPLDDVNGHGTHVAGIIGAQANNGGMVGVAWDVRFVSLKVFDDNGNGGANYTANLTSAVTYSATKGINIINHSGGGYGGSNSTFELALRNYSGLFVCSSGNNAVSTDINYFFPSSISASNLISVGATAYNSDGPATAVDWGHPVGSAVGSNFGKKTVDIFAPGTAIYSSVPYNISSSGYASWQGTSMATPYVTGVAALMRSKVGFDASTMKKIILGTADKTATSLNNMCVSGGRLDANNALNKVNYWISCHVGCSTQQQTCFNEYYPACQSDCEQQAMEMCPNNPSACWNWLISCAQNCEYNCTIPYNMCVNNCSN